MMALLINHGAAVVLAQRFALLSLHRRHLHISCHLGLGSFRVFSSASQNDGTTTSTTPSIKIRPSLPIAAFVDLDNVAPKTHRREDAKNLVSPILELGRLINNNYTSGNHYGDDGNGNVVTTSKSATSKKMKQKSAAVVHIEAFGNLSTRTYRGNAEQDHSLYQQDYIPWTEDDGFSDHDSDTGFAQTGYDSDNLLRCGVCGAKMKLSKKDRARGLSVEQKLSQHMKIHDREQNKRKANVERKLNIIMNKNQVAKKKNQKPLLSETDTKRYQKYESAQVGLKSSKTTIKQGKVKLSPRNDLFQVLREIGVKVKAEDDVDGALIRAAERWMARILKENSDSDTDNARDDNCKGVLVVYSKDSDFSPLLQRAKRKGFLTVSMTDKGKQTSELVKNSDIVIGPFSKWTGGTAPAADSLESGDGSKDFDDMKEVSGEEYDGDLPGILEEDSGIATDAEYEEFKGQKYLSSIKNDEELQHLSDDEAEDNDEISESDGEMVEEDLLDSDELNNRYDIQSVKYGESDNVGGGYEIREVQRPPLPSLSPLALSSADAPVQAIPISDHGLNFMIQRQGPQSGDGDDSVGWRLADRSNGQKLSPSGLEILVKKAERYLAQSKVVDQSSTHAVSKCNVLEVSKAPLTDEMLSSNVVLRHNANEDDIADNATEVEQCPVKIAKKLKQKRKKEKQLLDEAKAEADEKKARKQKEARRLADVAEELGLKLDDPNLPTIQITDTHVVVGKMVMQRASTYQCKGCGQVINSWKTFRKHLPKCKDCTPKMKNRKERKKNIVFLSPNDIVQNALKKIEEEKKPPQENKSSTSSKKRPEYSSRKAARAIALRSAKRRGLYR